MKYTVQRYFSGFCTNEVEAANEVQAVDIARNLPIDTKMVVSTLEPWHEADTVTPA